MLFIVESTPVKDVATISWAFSLSVIGIHPVANSRSFPCGSILSSKKKNWSKLRWKLLQTETTLTATIVWARLSYCYLTTANGMPHVDNLLPTQRVMDVFSIHCSMLEITITYMFHSLHTADGNSYCCWSGCPRNPKNDGRWVSSRDKANLREKVTWTLLVTVTQPSCA